LRKNVRAVENKSFSKYRSAGDYSSVSKDSLFNYSLKKQNIKIDTQNIKIILLNLCVENK
jgi:hypothetical protein